MDILSYFLWLSQQKSNNYLIKHAITTKYINTQLSSFEHKLL